MRQLGLLLIALASSVATACGPRPLPAGYAGDDARAFVRAHSAELQQEIATGSGPALYDLGVLAGCQDVPELGRRLRAKYSEIFTPGSVSAVGVVAAKVSSGDANAADLGGAEPGAAEVADRIVRILSERRELRCLELDLSRQSEWSAGRRHIGPRRSRLLLGNRR